MNLRQILITAGLVGLGFVVVANLGQLPQFWQDLLRLKWYVIPVFILIQLFSYYCNARYYQAFLAISHYRVGLWRLFSASLAINFANQAVPSGGVAGTTYLSEAVKPEAPAGAATLAQLGRYIFTFLTYLLVLSVGFLLLFIGNDFNKLSVRFVIILMAGVLVLGGVALAVFSERRRLEAILLPTMRWLNRLARKLGRRRPLLSPSLLEGFLDDFYQGYDAVVHHKHSWPELLGWSLAYNLAEVATVYVVFVGLGHWVNPGLVIVGYTLAIMASIAGFITGGVGVYELGMVATFAALGVPFALALSVVLLYRVLSLVLFLPPGFYIYHRHLWRERPAV